VTDEESEEDEDARELPCFLSQSRILAKLGSFVVTGPHPVLPHVLSTGPAC
jgi:hypothetical protein